MSFTRVDPLTLAESQMCPNCVTPWKCNGPHLSDETDFARARRLELNPDADDGSDIHTAEE